VKCGWSQLRGVQFTPGTSHADDRGSFVKVFDGHAFATTQVCVSANQRAGTVRGMHVQEMPDQETKRLWCMTGEVWDVLVDLRVDEPTYGSWAAIHLRADVPALLSVPPGVAHGFQTLTDGATLVYLIDGVFAPQSARTLRWDDPTVGIEWPLSVTMISANDSSGESWPVS
jgi:dTDP-4-dehydrorhamnose 3,5-epimerase